MTRRVPHRSLVASAIGVAAVLGLAVQPMMADTFDSAEPTILITAQANLADETVIQVTHVLIYEDSGIVFAHVRSGPLTKPTIESAALSALTTPPYGGPMTSDSCLGGGASSALNYTGEMTPMLYGGPMTSDRSLINQLVSWPDARSTGIVPLDDSFGASQT